MEKNDAPLEKRLRQGKILAAIAFLLSIFCLIMLFFLYAIFSSDIEDQGNQINTLIQEDASIKNYITRGIVNLTTESLQRINNDFLVSISSVNQHLTGVKIKGRIINSTTLDHEKVKLSVTIANNKNELIINRISSGKSTAFEVYVPDVPIAETQFATFQYIDSLIILIH